MTIRRTAAAAALSAVALLGVSAPAQAAVAPAVWNLSAVTVNTPTGCPRVGGSTFEGPNLVGQVTETVALPTRKVASGVVTAAVKVNNLPAGKYQEILSEIAIDNTGHIIGCVYDKPTVFTVNSRGQGSATTTLRVGSGFHTVQVTISRAGSVYDEVATTRYFPADVLV